MNAPQAITVTLNPAIDQLVTLDALLPGQVQRALGSVQAPGGKGINVAAALAGLGAPTAALGVLGSDNAGMFEALFAQRGIADACLRVPGQTRTNIKLVADGGRQTTDINLPGLALAEAHLDTVMSTLARYLRPGLAVVLSGSLPAGLPADSWARLQAQAVAAGADVLLDTSEAPWPPPWPRPPMRPCPGPSSPTGRSCRPPQASAWTAATRCWPPRAACWTGGWDWPWCPWARRARCSPPRKAR